MRGDRLWAPRASPHGASRAVPGGARPTAHCCKSGPRGCEFFYATAIYIEENTFPPSKSCRRRKLAHGRLLR
jgi:hypothetical protein